MDLRVLRAHPGLPFLRSGTSGVVPGEEGKHLQAVLSQHPCIQVKPLSSKCLDSGIENEGLYSSCGLDRAADPQGFIPRLVLFNIVIIFNKRWRKGGDSGGNGTHIHQFVSNSELWG